jgi:hypothetical protein
MAETITYSELVSIIVKELNKFRDDPMHLLPLLEKRMEQYDGKIYKFSKNQDIETEEGVGAVRELVTTLNATNRLPKLNWSFELHCAANKRAKMLARSLTFLEGGENQNTMPSLDELLANET